MSDLVELLAELCSLPAPSGREDPVRRLLVDRWRDRVVELHVDSVGNVVARVAGAGPKLLVHAHMDEISYVVRSITDDGFLLLDTGQGRRRDGPELRHMIGRDAVVVGAGGRRAEGLIAAPAGHVLTREQLDEPQPGWDDFFVDLGVRSRAEAEALGVHVGAGVVFAGAARRLGRRLVGKAMDDRVALAAIDLLLDELTREAAAWELWVAATVQEETGVHGARALAATRRFDAAIAVDVGLVGDVPGVGRSEYEAALGGGPSIVHKDALAFYDARLVDALLDVAAREGIAVQHGVYAGYGSDGVPFLDAGVPSALVTVPTRYTHTAFEMVDERDVHDLVRLLAAFVTTPTQGER
ncbi:MAG TPA: M20/M25/M40 family metallo-hydrolase [Gaiellaceae bacterium]